MTEANKQGQPLGLASTAELGLVERLRQRTLPKHGGREADSWAHHWNLTPGDSELHAEAATELERLNKWCDGMADAALKERAAAEANIQEMRDRLADVATMLKRCAWALRRGTAPELGERSLELLNRHDLLGSPLRDETLDEAGAAAAALYDRWTGKA